MRFEVTETVVINFDMHKIQKSVSTLAMDTQPKIYFYHSMLVNWDL